ncbi:MAG: hypothetical protein RIR26_1359 [Pseudomonadota bacterium]|jgi:hypothetical protein
MQARGLFSVAFCSVAVLSCGKKETASTTGAFLSLSDFPTTGLTELTAEQALVSLEGNSAVYDNEPNTGSTPTGGGSDSDTSGADKCVDLNAPKVTVINKDTLNVDMSVDLSTCLKSQQGTSTSTPVVDTSALQAKMRMVYNITCPGADLSEFNGQTMKDIGVSDGDSGVPAKLEAKCKDLSSFKKFGNASIEFKMGTFETTMKIAMFKKDGQACEWTKVSDGFKVDGCLNALHEMTKTPVAVGSTATADTKKTSLFETVNLVDSSDATAVWFGGGQLKFTLNNITGTLSYSSTSAAPTYTIAGGGTGTLGSSALLRESVDAKSPASTLPHSLLRAIARRLPF